jgi:hypothetical protein
MTNSLGHLFEKERINLEPMSKRDKHKAKLLDGNHGYARQLFRPLIPFRFATLKFGQCPVLEPSQIRPSGNNRVQIKLIGLEPDQQTPAFDVGYPRSGVIGRKPHHGPGS